MPRQAYCTGCNTIFDRMHVLMNHRRTHRCGGRFLSEEALDWIIEAHIAERTIKDIQEEDTVYARVHIHVPRVRHKGRTPGASRKVVQQRLLHEVHKYPRQEITHQRAS